MSVSSPSAPASTPAADPTVPGVVNDYVPSSDPYHDADSFFEDEPESPQPDPMVDRGGHVANPPDSDDPLESPPAARQRDQNGRFAKSPPVKNEQQPAQGLRKVAQDPAGNQAPADPLDGWDAEILSAAEHRGMTKEDLALFGDPEVARRAMVAMDRLALGRAPGAMPPGQQPPAAPQSNQPPAQPKQQATPPEPQKPVPAAPPASVAAALEKLALSISADDYDDGVVNQIAAINDHYHGHVSRQAEQIQQLTATVEQLMTVHRKNTEAQIVAEADGFFDSLPDELAESFGKGRTQDLSADDQVNLRREVFQDALKLRMIDADSGRAPMPLKEYMKRATDIRFIDKLKQSARREVAQAVAQRRGQSVARPTQRRAPSGSNEENAAAFVRDWQAAQGLNEPTIADELSVLE